MTNSTCPALQPKLDILPLHYSVIHMKSATLSRRSPKSFRLPTRLVERATRKARLHGKTVTDIVTESLEAYVAKGPLLGCCTHLRLKGGPMPVETSSIPLDEWGPLAR